MREQKYSFKDEFTTTDYVQRIRKENFYFERENNDVTVFCTDWDKVRLANHLAVESVKAFL